MENSDRSVGAKEKDSAALTSLVAAIGLTAFKVVVGMLTGSLGILAEAAHSGFDLIAAGMTFLAVRFSARPADSTHLYGHGKIENLSALFETLLLLLTCAWIVWEAVHRLSAVAGHVDVNIWSFLVMVVSIVVDYSRSRVLSRAATKFHSQALEADALHFETDIWSSAVVILGLIAVKLADWFPGLSLLRTGDAIAALGVCGVVVWVSVALGRRTIDALLDSAPSGMQLEIAKAVENVPGVTACRKVRIRSSGPDMFVDLQVLMEGEQTLNRAHAITEEIETVIHQLAPGADVTVHAEPL